MKLYTTTEAAAKLNCHPVTILRAASRLLLQKRGRDYLFSHSEVKKLAGVIHPTGGNPNWIAAGKANSKRRKK